METVNMCLAASGTDHCEVQSHGNRQHMCVAASGTDHCEVQSHRQHMCLAASGTDHCEVQGHGNRQQNKNPLYGIHMKFPKN
jgi:hypothetical protein